MKLKEIVPQYHSKNPLVKKLFLHRLHIAIKLAEPKLRSAKKLSVVDLGCGEGILLKLIEEKFKDVITFGIDIEPSIAELKDFLRAKIRIANIIESGFPNKFFDIVFCLDVLEHFQNLQEPVGEIKRILKENGLLVVSLPTENFFYKLGRFLTTGTTSMEKGPCSPHFYNAKTIEDFLYANNFQVIRKKLLPPISFLSLFHIIAFKMPSKNDIPISTN